VDYEPKVGSGITKDTDPSIDWTGFGDDVINKAAPRLDSFSFDSGGKLVITTTLGDSVIAGNILAQRMSDLSALQATDGGLYSDAAAGASAFNYDEARPGTKGLARIKSNHLEQSNVQITKAFAAMIIDSNNIQAQVKAVSTGNDILSAIINGMKR
jgi:flagellar hook protein FlgE